jgi:alkylation response protein AidB-like acyl-CoA dehydrogenase
MILELTPAQAAFRDTVEQFARETVAPRAPTIDDTGEYPADVIRAAAARGLLGVALPKAWGGGGRDGVSYALTIEARARPGAPGAVAGAFALSEPDAGTDAANQQTKAVRTGDGYRITGRKVWVANADAASLVVVFAATRPSLRSQGVTAFLVPMDTRGISRTARADSLGVRGLGCQDLDFDITVGDDQVLGAVDQGFRLAMWALDGGRIAIAAQALGIGRAALDEAIAYAKQRETFGKPIASYQAIQWMLADSATELDAARMLTLKAAAAKDRQERVTMEASMAKLAASEAAHRAADRAMQVLASAGYRRGSVVERLFRDVRATEIYQGTSEAQRMIIAQHALAGA